MKYLSDFLISSYRKFPEKTALEVGDAIVCYKDLYNRALEISLSLNNIDCRKMVGVLGSRNLQTFENIAGVLFSGKGYVPLNPNFPVERTIKMILLSGIETILVSDESIDYVNDILKKINKKIKIIFQKDIEREIDHINLLPREPEDGTDIAYLLFTSGSTGEPKGVGVTHNNAASYIDYAIREFFYTENDRTTQTFDLTFDLSVHDMFVSWGAGSCLCVLSAEDTYFPANFIKNKKITCWFSVPTMAMIMGKMNFLKKNAFPNLRLSLFCGEALPKSTVMLWSESASNSEIENIYGPTEATIAITRYRWERSKSVDSCRLGLVPIGKPFKGQEAALLDVKTNDFLIGEGKGELILSGSQVTPGYWNDIDKTNKSFIQHTKTNQKIWYKTGDLVERDKEGCLYFVGRVDNQVKINGYRVELSEIENVIRKVSGIDLVIAVAWPKTESGAQGIVAFVEGTILAEKTISQCEDHLPNYMMPTDIYMIERLPVNSNGKVDRKALLDKLELM